MTVELDWEGNWKGPRNLGTCTLGTWLIKLGYEQDGEW